MNVDNSLKRSRILEDNAQSPEQKAIRQKLQHAAAEDIATSSQLLANQELSQSSVPPSVEPPTRQHLDEYPPECYITPKGQIRHNPFDIPNISTSDEDLEYYEPSSTRHAEREEKHFDFHAAESEPLANGVDADAALQFSTLENKISYYARTITGYEVRKEMLLTWLNGGITRTDARDLLIQFKNIYTTKHTHVESEIDTQSKHKEFNDHFLNIDTGKLSDPELQTSINEANLNIFSDKQSLKHDHSKIIETQSRVEAFRKLAHLSSSKLRPEIYDHADQLTFFVTEETLELCKEKVKTLEQELKALYIELAENKACFEDASGNLLLPLHKPPRE